MTSFDPKATTTLLNRFARVRHTGTLLQSDLQHARRTPGLGDLVDRFALLYAAIEEHTGAGLVVDSSKFPSHAALLRLLPNVDACFVQLVRDPRAVAYSWSRPKEGPDGIPRCGSVFSSTKWVQWNLACEKVERAVGPDRYVTLRYEDFVAAPRESVDRLLSLAGYDAEFEPAVIDGHAVLAASHTINGNPDRFETGAIPIREDARWLRSLSFAPWGISTTLTAPLLRRYGYEWRTGAPWQRRLSVG